LRERQEDVDGLVGALLQRAAARAGRGISVTAEALQAIKRGLWPGNVRQLENALERAAVLSKDGVVRGDAFADVPRDEARRGAAVGRDGRDTPLPLKRAVELAEREAIRHALAAADGSRKEAANVLGVSLRSLFYKLKQHGLE
jgi:DNA-binding NtrC family response regulator